MQPTEEGGSSENNVMIGKNAASVLPEAVEEGSFLLWVGEMELPWLQQEDMASVVSPANLPEFMQRMEQVWLLRHGTEYVYS